MKLREWDDSVAQHGAWVEREYPDDVVAEFVNWFRQTRQWRESPEMCYDQWRRFELRLSEIRSEAAEVAAPPTVPDGPAEASCTATTRAGKACRGKAVQGGLCISHLRTVQAA